MKTANDVLKAIKDNDVKYVDFRFTDPRGKWQHVTFDVSIIDEEVFADGVMFDGSSIAGWKAINESDMTLMPDPATACIDPFFSAPTLSIVCDILEPATGEPYNRDPRGIAKKAEAYLKSTGVGDTIYFGPEAEFFIFDDVRFMADPYNTGFQLDGIELPTNGDTDYEGGNLGHRVQTKGGYFPVPPLDSAQDMRGEMLAAMAAMGVKVEKHHHEVASAQHELGMKFDTLVLHGRPDADLQVLHPQRRPELRQDGHLHAEAGLRRQRLGHARAPVDLEGRQAGVRRQQIRRSQQECLWYIGGIIKHAKALNAFTNPSTNSYKRLVPGYEAPVLLAYSARNRSASCRIPWTTSPEGQARRGPLPRSGRQPLSRLRGDAHGRPRRHHQQDRSRPGHGQGPLRSAAARAEEDPDRLRLACARRSTPSTATATFLKAGGVFNDDFIDSYIELKMTEVARFEMTPHPVEYVMYYSA